MERAKEEGLPYTNRTGGLVNSAHERQPTHGKSATHSQLPSGKCWVVSARQLFPARIKINIKSAARTKTISILMQPELTQFSFGLSWVHFNRKLTPPARNTFRILQCGRVTIIPAASSGSDRPVPFPMLLHRSVDGSSGFWHFDSGLVSGQLVIWPAHSLASSGHVSN